MIKLKNNDIDKVHKTNDFGNALEWILDECGEKGNIELWFTNSTKFDTHFILRSFLTKNNYTQTLNNKIKEKEFNLLEPTRIGAMIVRLCFAETIFIVRDIKLYISLSVKEKGALIGVEKGSFKNTNIEWLSNDGEINWNKLDWDNLSKYEMEAIEWYAKKDALADAVYNIKHFETLGFPKKLTKSGEAFIKAVNHISKENLFRFEKMYLTIKNENVWTRHIQGGLNYTNPNRIMKLYKNVLELDKTSMYPDNMREELPLNGGSENGTPFDLKLFRIRIFSIEMKKEYEKKVGQGFLPSNTIERNDTIEHDFTTTNYITKAKNITVEKWEEEWEWYKKIYDIDFEILEIKYFKKGNHLKNLIENMYSEREKEKILVETDKKNAGIHEIKQNDIKISMNSIYGVLMENPIRQQYFYSVDEYELGDEICSDDEKNIQTIVGKSTLKTNGYTRYITQNKIIPEYRKNLYIGSYITMKGRVFMYPHILTGELIRLDTDGFTAIKQWQIPENFVRDGLGGMKIEKKKMKKYFICVGAKAYFYNDTRYFNKYTKYTFKGIHKLKIKHGTRLDKIEWDKIKGETRNRKLTNNGISLIDTKKTLHKQAEYYKRIKK